MASKNTQHNNVADAVMEDIRKKNVRMHSPAYFVLLSVLLGAGMGATVIIALFSATVLWVRINLYDPFEFFIFGPRGVPPFMAVFPWGAFVVAVGGIGMSVWLLKRYDFSYKKSFLPPTVVMIAGITVLGFASAHAAVRTNIYQAPPLHLLSGPEPQHRSWIVGQVIAVGNSELIVQTPRKNQIRVVWNDATKFTRKGIPSEGDLIRAVGVWRDDVFEVRLFHRDQYLFPKRSRR